MITFDNKKALDAILSKRTPKGEALGAASMKPEVVKSANGEIDGRHTAAQDAMMAISEKSPEKFMQALGNFVDLHKGE